MIITKKCVEDKVFVRVPFSAIDARYELKKLSGKWDPDSRSWVLSKLVEDKVEEILKSQFGGYNLIGKDAIVIRATKNIEEYGQGIYCLGREILAASGRDSGVKRGDGVAILSGYPRSGGSVKHWKTIVPEGTVLLVQRIPLDKISRDENGKPVLPEEWEVVEEKGHEGDDTEKKEIPEHLLLLKERILSLSEDERKILLELIL